MENGVFHENVFWEDQSQDEINCIGRVFLFLISMGKWGVNYGFCNGVIFGCSFAFYMVL